MSRAMGSGGWAWPGPCEEAGRWSDPQKDSHEDVSRILSESSEPGTSPVLRGPRQGQDSQRPKVSHP